MEISRSFKFPNKPALGVAFGQMQLTNVGQFFGIDSRSLQVQEIEREHPFLEVTLDIK
ncbi:MAG TPA: hypothetical protein VK184_18915 [Nostocaceae cyanobacterium]|nr:hypothetical protein [Nostocaceae cyanobacterium]